MESTYEISPLVKYELLLAIHTGPNNTTFGKVKYLVKRCTIIGISAQYIDTMIYLNFVTPAGKHEQGAAT